MEGAFGETASPVWSTVWWRAVTNAYLFMVLSLFIGLTRQMDRLLNDRLVEVPPESDHAFTCMKGIAMDSAFISGFSALAGSIVGGLTAGITTWMSHRSQARSTHLMHKVTHREDLYRDFIVAASAIFGNALANTEPQIHELVVLYGMMSRMRVLSSPDVIEAAELVIDGLIDAYDAPNRTVREIRTLMRNGEAMDPLREFSAVARKDLHAL